MLLVGVGIGITFPALNIEATSGVSNHEQGLASGLVQSSLQLGGALVLAIVTAVASSNGAASSRPDMLLHAYRTALIVVVVVAFTGLFVALSDLRWKRS
jgi:fucose permease